MANDAGPFLVIKTEAFLFGRNSAACVKTEAEAAETVGELA